LRTALNLREDSPCISARLSLCYTVGHTSLPSWTSEEMEMLRTCYVLVLLAGYAGLAMAQDKKEPGKQPATPRPNYDAIYKLGPDSKKQEGVPEGVYPGKQQFRGKVYDSVEHDFAVYLPHQLDKSKPVKLMVFLDGASYGNPTGPCRVPVVFNNLMHRKELPPIVGVFVEPGFPLDSDGNRKAQRGNQRSIEYDTLSPKYATFLEKDLLPWVEKQYELKFSTNPEDRAICGISSGGICAFTVAWERPDLFHKVMTHVGSFTNIRGGHVYHDLVRRSASNPKPIRVFLQGGANDLDNQFGNWPLANQQMAASLKFAKYDYRFEFGTGGHSLVHGASIMPEALKWLWREGK
ncbi:MAG TPA: alpha/beta hydrolase-fold protein, partial [Gemmatales bacterium]|nr:alpha/beta hydrolase-fold protein [Gemmatales bacterium]